MSSQTIERKEIESASQTGRDYVVIAHNNDTNTFDEVTYILMIATQCSLDEASMETWEIDHLGQSVVHISSQEECERAAAVISSIGVRTEVTKNL